MHLCSVLSSEHLRITLSDEGGTLTKEDYNTFFDNVYHHQPDIRKEYQQILVDYLNKVHHEDGKLIFEYRDFSLFSYIFVRTQSIDPDYCSMWEYIPLTIQLTKDFAWFIDAVHCLDPTATIYLEHC